MHIVFATTEFMTEKGYDGGLANYLEKASQILSEHGHRVTVVVLSTDNQIIEYRKNIRVARVLQGTVEIDLILRHIKSDILRRTLSCCWNSYKINKKIKAIHREDKVDMVQYCHLSALGLFRTKIPSVVRMSSFGPTMQLISAVDFQPGKGRLQINALDKLNMIAMKRADGIFAPSILNARLVERIVGIKVNVLETPAMGVDCDKIKNVPMELAGKKYFLFFGTMSGIKGLKTIVNAIYQILDKNPGFDFVFVGKDCGVSMKEGVKSPAIKKLKEAAKEYGNRIIYLQTIKDRERLNSIIYHASLCILPYRLENLPNTCIEAMELGQIVISTYKSGISQLIRDGYNGFLVEQNDEEALVNKISEVLQLSCEEKKRISKNAQKRVAKMSPENFYQYMMQYYEDVMSRRKKLRRNGENNEKKIT